MLWGLKSGTLIFTLIAFISLVQLQNAAPCGDPGAPCLAASQCCSNICSPARICAPEPCRANGLACTSPVQCCSSFCDASGNCSPQGTGSANWYDSIYIWVGLAVTISALFLGLAYMAAKMFEVQMLDAWVKIELHELVMSFLIAVFCVGLIASVDVFSGLLIGEMNTNGSAVGTMAINSLTGMYNDGRDIYASLGDAYYKIAKIASYSYTVGLNLGFISTSTSRSPASGLSTLAAEVGGAMDSVSNYMLALAAQQALIIFFINSAQILLPVGIFMRSFSLTRKAGAGVLAAVISTSVIYPASFVISEAVHQTYRGNMLSGLSNLSLIPDPGNPPLSSIACSPWMQWVVESPLGMVVGLVAGGVSNIPGMGEFTATFISSIGMALFGGENGWFLTVCPIACTVTCAPTVAGFAACFSLCMTRCYEVFQVVYPITVSGFALITWPMLGGYAPDLNTAQDVAVYYAPLRDSALPAVAKYSVLSIVFTLIPAIITIVLMRNLAMLFGGEPQFYGLSKLV